MSIPPRSPAPPRRSLRRGTALLIREQERLSLRWVPRIPFSLEKASKQELPGGQHASTAVDQNRFGSPKEIRSSSGRDDHLSSLSPVRSQNCRECEFVVTGIRGSEQNRLNQRPSVTSSDFDHYARPWTERLQCPSCGASVTLYADLVLCRNETCIYSDRGFPVVDGQPVLIDFLDSVFPRSNYERGNGSALPRALSRRGLRSRLHLLVDGSNPVAAKNCERFLAILKEQKRDPFVLVVGGGVIGLGADKLYADPDVSLIGTDVYASPHTNLLADAHKLPFANGTFDGVWIQAVLEHVLDPATVVDELHRVLKPGGLVYAETPFMQQVHERAYDFTRFTQSGHRWLFRRFEEINAGPITGPATVLLWSIRYLLRALGAGEKVSQAVPLMLCWIRFLDRFCKRRGAADGAGGVFFLGSRSESPIPAIAMPEYYEQQVRRREQRHGKTVRGAPAWAVRRASLMRHLRVRSRASR